MRYRASRLRPDSGGSSFSAEAVPGGSSVRSSQVVTGRSSLSVALSVRRRASGRAPPRLSPGCSLFRLTVCEEPGSMPGRPVPARTGRVLTPGEAPGPEHERGTRNVVMVRTL